MLKRLKMSEFVEKYGNDAANTYFMSCVWQASEGQASPELINVCNRIANEFCDAAQEFREFFGGQFPKS